MTLKHRRICENNFSDSGKLKKEIFTEGNSKMENRKLASIAYKYTFHSLDLIIALLKHFFGGGQEIATKS